LKLCFIFCLKGLVAHTPGHFWLLRIGQFHDTQTSRRKEPLQPQHCAVEVSLNKIALFTLQLGAAPPRLPLSFC
jgi:hypothetical protein